MTDEERAHGRWYDGMMRGRRLILVTLLAAAMVPYFLNLGATSIIDANEAFYTETPREMIESGRYVSPSFNYEPRLNKPPLSYWVVAASYRVFGVSLAAARLPIGLGAMVIVATAFLLGRLAFSTDAGLVAAATLAAAPRVMLFSRRIIIDVYTTMFVGLTLLCFTLAETDPARRKRWLLAMYVSTALGVLTKGPVAIALPALVFTVYLVVSGRLRTIGTLMLPTGALVVAAIVVPYYGALYAQEGWNAISSFLLQENLARYAFGVGAPDRGPLFYLPVVFADFYFPWSLALPVAFALVPWRTVLAGSGWGRVWGAPDGEGPVSRERVRLLLGLWIVLIVAFFSLSNGQQDLYVLPFVAAGAPLLGGLVARWLGEGRSADERPGRLDRATTWSLAAVAVVLVVVGVASAWFLGRPGGRFNISGVMAAGAVLSVGGVAALVALARRARFSAFASMLGAVVICLWVLVGWSLPDFERYKPVHHLAGAIAQVAVPPAPVATYRVAAPSLVYYLRRHVTELFTEAELDTFLRGHPHGVCVMLAEDYAAMKARLPVPTRILATSPRFETRLADLLDRSPLRDLILVGPA